MSIQVNQITKIYGTQKALDDVSLQTKPGEIVGLLGPNGAGKSTLMKILTCYIPPTTGSASVCGFDVMEQSIEVRRRVGYLPENNPLYLDLYVKEFLAFIAGTHGLKDPGRRIGEMIGITGLEKEQSKKLGALSKGYRQRVGLAQALLHDPGVLILDEPTSGLDPNQLLEIRNLIKMIGKEKTVLLSTHIMQEVEAICDRAIIIHHGSIVADDSTRNLQQISSSRVIIRVEFSTPVDHKTIMQVPHVLEANPASLPAGRQVASNTWHLASSSDFDIRPEIFNFAVEHKLTVLSMSREEQKLEEVFQELTKN